MTLRMPSRKTAGLVLVIVTMAALFVHVAMRSGPLAPVPVTTTSLDVRDLKPGVSGVGTIEARYTHRLGPVAAGRLVSVSVQPGDGVVAGQVVAELDPIDLDQRLGALRAAIERAQATLRELEARRLHASTEAARYERAFAARAVSEEVVAAKRLELEVSESARSAARKGLELARSDHAAAIAQRENLVLLSPIDGVVAARLADPGTTVVAGQAVVEIIDPDEVWIHARFDQVGGRELVAGLASQVEFRSREGVHVAARIARVEPRADAVTEERLAKLAFQERPQPLPPLGEFVHVTVSLPELPDTPSIPGAAIHRVGHETGVWKVVGRAVEFVPVRTGTSDPDGYIEVLDGIGPTDKVVVYSASRLTAQSRVREVERIAGTGG